MIQAETEDFLIQLSDNMANSKVDLLKYIEHFNEKMSPAYEDAEFLIQSQNDVNVWIDMWDGDPEAVDAANAKLREWKIEQHMMEGYEGFADLLYMDQEDFIVTYFQQPYGQRTMWELNRVLGEMSVRELWEIHSKFPMDRIEYL